MSQQTVFITGGSGYIGSVVTSFFVAQHYTVRALSRSENSDVKLQALGAIPVRGALTSHDTLTHEASSADIVIHIGDARMNDLHDLEKGYAINDAAIEALAKGIHGTQKKLILTSGSLFTAPDPKGNETSETSPKWAVNPFGRGMESSLPSLQKMGVNYNVIRLAPWVYGRAGSGVKLLLAGAATAGVMTYVEPETKYTTTVHVDDAAHLYLLAAQKGAAGEAYNASSETNVTFRELAEAMGKILDVPVLGLSFEDMEGRVGRFFATFLSSENRASNAKARSELGWKVGAEKGILEEIASGSYVQLVDELRKSKVTNDA
ncbi:putative NAD dependent epimerase/dehydratase [Setomelanomma holmii]|uniref:NAD dependent epimerase/dehydratase n=1 Tax=Setomelanomma holmii TaxID=210430 RepID=A0A9P4HJ95_9PLEO|nr:putative NAD dependent epimerase/dehydratase [Setomelanomma holmii]